MRSVFFASSVAIVTLALAGCASHVDGEAPTASADEDLSTKKPIPFVLQYVGEYEGIGRIERVVLARNGRFEIRVDGHTHRGNFYGPTGTPTRIAPPALVLVTSGQRYDAQVDRGAAWKAHDTLEIAIDGVTEQLTAPWHSGDESMCDDSDGHWTDDDADPATGLYCVCGAPKAFIPSLGGCVN